MMILSFGGLHIDASTYRVTIAGHSLRSFEYA